MKQALLLVMKDFTIQMIQPGCVNYGCDHVRDHVRDHDYRNDLCANACALYGRDCGYTFWVQLNSCVTPRTYLLK